jgi:hypothetical protein
MSLIEKIEDSGNYYVTITSYYYKKELVYKIINMTFYITITMILPTMEIVM